VFVVVVVLFVGEGVMVVLFGLDGEDVGLDQPLDHFDLLFGIFEWDGLHRDPVCIK